MRNTILFHRAAAVVILTASVLLMAAARPKPAVIELPKGNWNTNLTSGVQAALKPDVPAMVMLSANWCPDCKRMKKAVFTDLRVQAMLNDWNTIYIDTDTYPTLMDVFKTKWIPTVVLLDTKGDELSRAQDDMTPEQFVAWANDMCARSAMLAELDAQLAKRPTNKNLLPKKADTLADLGMFTIKVDQRVMIANVARLTEALKCYENTYACGANIVFIPIVIDAVNGKTKEASDELNAFENQFPKETLGGDVLFWQAAIVRLEQQAAARAAKAAKTTPPTADYAKMSGAFAAYLAKYPKGRYADAAQRMIETLKSEQANDQKAAAKQAKRKTPAPIEKSANAK